MRVPLGPFHSPDASIQGLRALRSLSDAIRGIVCGGWRCWYHDALPSLKGFEVWTLVFISVTVDL